MGFSLKSWFHRCNFSAACALYFSKSLHLSLEPICSMACLLCAGGHAMFVACHPTLKILVFWPHVPALELWLNGKRTTEMNHPAIRVLSHLWTPPYNNHSMIFSSWPRPGCVGRDRDGHPLGTCHRSPVGSLPCKTSGSSSPGKIRGIFSPKKWWCNMV